MSALEKALSYSKKFKLDECEIVISSRRITTVRITDSEIFELKKNFEKSYGIRIIEDKKITSFQTNDEKEIPLAIGKNFENLHLIKKREFWKSLPSELKSKISLGGVYDKKLEDVSGSFATDLAQSMINSSTNAQINSISGSLNIVSEIFEIGNSKGLSLEDKGTYISGIINADSEGSEVSGIGHGCGRTLASFFPEKIGEDAKTMCIESINPKICDSGVYSIIFEPYSVGEILSFVASSNFNFKTYSEKKSCFSEKINENIATNNLSLIDNPHLKEGIGSKPFDDEGIQTKINTIIDKGKFVNTFSNLFDGFKENSESTGNGSRSGSPMGRNSDPIPMSLPHNMEIQSGDITREEMIKDTKHGLIVGRLWYTYAVNPIKGDFSCTARSGIRIIENGKIINPGKPVRIIHSLPKFLKNISAIGKDKKNVIQWASIPSSTPSIRVEQIKVTPIN